MGFNKIEKLEETVKKYLTKILKEDIQFNEEYPSSFNMDEFLKISSFSKRIEYCETNLSRIGSGSSRIVYKIDNEKVLKLAKNSKGISQNEVEIQHGNDYYLKDLGIIAEVFNYDENELWLEMQLAQKCSKGKFLQINEIGFDDYCNYLSYYESDVLGKSRFKTNVSDEIKEKAESNEFVGSMIEFIGNYDIPIGDLKRINSYGVVIANGSENVVLVDYGLTDDVYNTHYKRK